MLKYYPSLGKALRAAYPEYNWDVSRFSELDRLPRRYWRNTATQRAFLEQLGNELGIREVCFFSSLFCFLFHFLVFSSSLYLSSSFLSFACLNKLFSCSGRNGIK